MTAGAIACCCGEKPGLYVFDPCEPFCTSHKMAGAIEDWATLLGLQVDSGDPSGYDLSEVYLYTPNVIECCTPVASDPLECLRFCGSLRLATEGEVKNFCFEVSDCPNCPPTGTIQIVDENFDAGTFTKLTPDYDCDDPPCTGCRPIQCEPDTYLKITIVKLYRLFYDCDVPNVTTGETFSGGCNRKFKLFQVSGNFNLEFSVELDAYLKVNLDYRDYNAAPDPKAWIQAVLSRHETCETDCIDIRSVTIEKNSFLTGGGFTILTEQDPPNDGTFVNNTHYAWDISGSLNVTDIAVDTVKIQKVDDLWETAFDAREDFGGTGGVAFPEEICDEVPPCAITYFCPMQFNLNATATLFNKNETNSDTDCDSFDDDFADSGAPISSDPLIVEADMGKVAPGLAICCCSTDPSADFRLKTVKESNALGFGPAAGNVASIIRNTMDPNRWNVTFDVGSITWNQNLEPWEWDRIFTDLNNGNEGLVRLFQDDANTPPDLSFGEFGKAYLNDSEQTTDYVCDPDADEENFGVSFTATGRGEASGGLWAGATKTMTFNCSIVDTITAWECVTEADLPPGCSCDG